MHKISQGNWYRKLIAVLRLNGKEVEFEVDTGAEMLTHYSLGSIAESNTITTFNNCTETV